MSYHHLSISERECILHMHYNKKSVTQIAEVLNRSKSSISRELRRNTGTHGYSAYEAQNSYVTRRKVCKPRPKVMKLENHKHIISGLENYWSPEQIINHHRLGLCTATIYRALTNGVLPTILRENLRQKGKPRKVEGEEKRGTIPDCISIDDRPVEVADRNRVGDWEGDTVAGKWRTGCFMTLVRVRRRFV